MQGGLSSFGRKPLAPLIRREPPADLHGGRERRGKGCRPETHITNEVAAVQTLDGPKAVAELGPALANQLDETTRAFVAVERGKVLHHQRVRIHRREWVNVDIAPFPQPQPLPHPPHSPPESQQLAPQPPQELHPPQGSPQDVAQPLLQGLQEPQALPHGLQPFPNSATVSLSGPAPNRIAA